VCATNVAARPDFLAAHPSAGCKLVKVQALTLEAVKRDPAVAIRSLEQTLGVTSDIAKETYETLTIPSLESQVDPNAPWSLTAENGGLAQKLFLAAEALHEAKIFEKALTLDQIRKSIDSRYVAQYLANKDC